MARGLLRRAPRILLIAGVDEARLIGDGLTAAGAEVIAALDRRSAEIDSGQWDDCAARRGLFAGAEGLMTALKWDRVDAVVDASHPFDAMTAAQAAQACRALGTPLYRLARPVWPAGEGRGRRSVADGRAAADAAPLLARVYLGLDYTPLEIFRDRLNTWFLARISRPSGRRFPLKRGDYALAPRPLTVAHERILMQDRRIGWVVLENAGGGPGGASLAAAEALGLTILLIDPPAPPAAPVQGGVYETPEALLTAAAARLGL